MRSQSSKVDKAVSKFYRISLRTIFSRQRERRWSEKRQLIWYLRYHLEGKTYTELKEIYGWDHSTIIFGVRQADNRIDAYPLYRDEVLHIKDLIGNL